MHADDWLQITVIVDRRFLHLSLAESDYAETKERPRWMGISFVIAET